MAYQPNSTFITFPNGEIQDVAGCGLTIKGNALLITQGSSVRYQYPFDSPTDARIMAATISQAVAAYNTNPLFAYAWSTDAVTWYPGPIPITSNPLYIQVTGTSVVSGASCQIVDFSGNTFNNIPADVASPTLLVVGPFNGSGSNTPALGGAFLFMLDASGSIAGSLEITFSQTSPFLPTVSLVQWGVSISPLFNQPVNGAADFLLVVTGTNFPMDVATISAPASLNSISAVASAASTIITTNTLHVAGAPGGAIPTGTYQFTVNDGLGNLLFSFPLTFL